MAKQKKKRTKRYQGEDAAASSQPVVHRFQAVDRSAASQWWVEKKRSVTLVAKIVFVAGIVGWLLFELVKLVF